MEREVWHEGIVAGFFGFIDRVSSGKIQADRSLPGRLTVGRDTLNVVIVVRIHAGQLIKLTSEITIKQRQFESLSYLEVFSKFTFCKVVDCKNHNPKNYGPC